MRTLDNLQEEDIERIFKGKKPKDDRYYEAKGKPYTHKNTTFTSYNVEKANDLNVMKGGNI